jgi:hypothetical protein
VEFLQKEGSQEWHGSTRSPQGLSWFDKLTTGGLAWFDKLTTRGWQDAELLVVSLPNHEL